MNKITAKEGKYLTQVAELPIEERMFVREVSGIIATSEYFREATSEEIAEWKEYLASLEDIKNY